MANRYFLRQIFRDVCCHREILALKVFCRAEAKGCQEQMSLQQMPVSPTAARSRRLLTAC